MYIITANNRQMRTGTRCLIVWPYGRPRAQRDLAHVNAPPIGDDYMPRRFRGQDWRYTIGDSAGPVLAWATVTGKRPLGRARARYRVKLDRLEAWPPGFDED